MRVGVTIGDPAGVGPEVALKAALHPDVKKKCELILIGSAALIEEQAQELKLSSLQKESLNIVNVQDASWDLIDRGAASLVSGELSLAYLEASVKMLLKHDIDAVATAPIHKASWHMAGINYPGHTEFFAEKFNAQSYMMSFFSPEMRLALVSRHIPIHSVSDYLTEEKVLDVLAMIHQCRHLYGCDNGVKIAVCGLNPHAGEVGGIGREEIDVISPAIKKACKLGMDVSGPFPADTLFVESQRVEYDFIVAMYHDQGLIPFKMIAFDTGVNVTLGLPYIRTSVDHGTAFDIVGKNKANEMSMVNAICLAADMAVRQNKKKDQYVS